MRRIRLVIAILVVAALVAGAGVIAFNVRTRMLNTESGAFVKRTASAFAATWNTGELVNHGTPEFYNKFREADPRSLRAIGARLGPLDTYLGETGGVSIRSEVAFGSPISASYTAKVRFSGGVATFEFFLIRNHGQWLIDDFGVNGTLFNTPGFGLLFGPPAIDSNTH